MVLSFGGARTRIAHVAVATTPGILRQRSGVGSSMFQCLDRKCSIMENVFWWRRRRICSEGLLVALRRIACLSASGSLPKLSTIFPS
jgi:hypothetical protein